MCLCVCMRHKTTGTHQSAAKMGALSSLFAFATLAGATLATASSASTVACDGLAISAPTNGRYMYRTKSGDPFLWMADTNWELFHRLNKTDAELYLADRAAKGFTVVNKPNLRIKSTKRLTREESPSGPGRASV